MTLTKEIKWFRVAAVGSIPMKEGRRVQYGEQTLALFNLGKEYLVIENQCPHKAGPLSDGIVSGKNVFCPLHNWKISLETGCALSGGTGQVKTYPVKIINHEIFIAFEEGKLKERISSLREGGADEAISKPGLLRPPRSSPLGSGSQ